MSLISHNNLVLGRQNQSGSILILVLIVTASLTVVAFSLAYRCRIELRLAGSSAKQVQLQYLAYGGIQRCLALLSEQKLEPAVTLAAGHFFSSAGQEGLFVSNTPESEDHACLYYWVVDEYSRLSINRSDPSCWEDAGLLNRSQIAGILDWIDTDDDTNPDGAESDYYQRLEVPETCKNAPLLTLRELLNIKEITPVYYSTPFSTVFANLPNNANVTALQQTLSQETSLNMHLFFSVHGDGKLNINTAPFQVLSILPGLDESTANTLLTYRLGADRNAGTEDDGCVTNVGDIAKVEGLSELEVELLGQYCCFNSDTFRIYSCAKNANAICLLCATVKIIEDQPSIVNVERIL